MGMRYLPINSGSTAVTKVIAEKIQLIINKKERKESMKRVLCLLLVIVMLFSVVACAKTEDPGETSESLVIDETDKSAFSTVRKEDYQGAVIDLVYRAASAEWDFNATEPNGEVLNDAVFEKNLMVSETLNVELNVIGLNTTGELVDAVRKDNMSGDSAYDFCGIPIDVITLSTEGLLYDLKQMSDIDTTQQWWDQSFVNNMSINGSVYALLGDISVTVNLASSALCFNKQLFKELNMEEPYDLVREGKWTYDKLLEYVAGYSTDITPDGIWDENDQYGITGWASETAFSTFYGSGFQFAKINASGELEIDYDRKKVTNIYDKIYRLWITENNYFVSGSSSKHSFAWDVFADDRALFVDTVISKIGQMLSEMESDYGIIPQPKYDEDADYASYIAYTIPITCVPKVVADPQMVGNVIEAYCTASYDIVTPDLFEIVTKLQHADDLDSGEMIDIIIRNKVVDPAHWFMLNGFSDFSMVLLNAKTNTVSSYLKSATSGAAKQVENINKAYKGITN